MTVVATSILTLTDVFDGVSILLSSTSTVVPTDDLGNAGNFSGCTTSVKVMNGKDDVTSSYQITPVSSVGVTGSYSNGVYTVTGMSSDVGTVDFTATRFGFETLTARWTITKAKRGAEGLTIVVANENHTLPADASGIVSNYTGSGTTVQVFEGATALSATSTASTNGTFTIGLPTVTPAGKITVGGRSYAGTEATVLAHTGMASDTDILTITYPIIVKRRDGSTVTVNKSQTIAKAKQNAPVSRGTVHVYAAIVGNAWDDAAANSALASAPHNGKIVADRVTLYNQAAGWSQTRAWSGSAWLVVSEVVDGNLLVTKSILADKLNLNDLFSKTVTVTGQLSVGDTTNFVKIGGANHILAQAGSRVLFSVNSSGGLIDGYGLLPGSVSDTALSAAALDKIRSYVGSSAPVTGGTKTINAPISVGTFTLGTIPSGGTAVNITLAYLGGSESSLITYTPTVPKITATIKRNGVDIATQTFSGTILGGDRNGSQRYWDVALPTINWSLNDPSPGSGSVVYSVSITTSDYSGTLYGNLTFTASQATTGAAPAAHTHTAAELNVASLAGNNQFLGGGSFRAFSIRNTDANSWSWFAMGGSSDSGGNVWHIATTGSATDIGLGGALHIRGNNGADSSMVINQDHTVRFRNLNIYAGATNSSNGWRLWHDGNAPVYATRWPTLAEIGAIGSAGGSFNGVVTFNSEVNTNNMMSVSAPMIGADDHVCSPISIRERGRVAAAQYDHQYAPNLNFHWAGRVSNSLWMDYTGAFCFGTYDGSGVPYADGTLKLNTLSASAVYGDTFSTIGKGGMIVFNGTGGMIVRTQDAGGGFARGIVAEHSSGNRLGGAGFYGGTDYVNSFAISFNHNWWVSPQFEVVPSNINLNSTYLTLTQGWDISWGGRWSSGYPTMTGNMGALYLYPNGSTGGAYNLTTSKLQFPTPFNTYMGPTSGVLGFFTDVGNAKPLAVGGLTISNSYADVASTPGNGLLVRGATQFLENVSVRKDNVSLAQPIWHPDGANLQLYSSGGSPVALCWHRGGYTAVGLVHNGDGLYLTDGAFKAPRLRVDGSNSSISGGVGNVDAISVRSAYGYIDIGALNSFYAHITTDRDSFYMNKPLEVSERLVIYGTPWYFGKNSVANISSLQARHIEGMTPNGLNYDTLYLNYLSNNNVMIGYNGTAMLIAKNSSNQVMSRWVSSEDARSVGLRAPAEYTNLATYEFLAGATAGNSGEGYIGSIVFRPYGTGNDWSGGPMHKLHFGQDTGKIWHQTGNGSGWGQFREIPQYESNGYLYARNWINIPNGTGLFWNSGTHLFSVGDGQTTLRGNSAASYISMQTNGGTTQGFLYAENGGNIGFLGQNSLWAVRVDANNMVWMTDFTVTSDSRVKSNQRPIDNALTRLRGIVGKTYRRDDQGGVESAGVIAQDVLAVLPEAVSINDKTGRYSVNYNAVIGLLVEAIKALSNKVDTLERQWQQ